MADEANGQQAVQLPVKELDEALPYLRRPFPAHAIGWKVQTTAKGERGPLGGNVVAYIDARLVVDRLNLVVGSRWTFESSLSEQNPRLMWGKLTVCDVARTDIGESSKGLSKDIVSDALKRAAVQFGIGVAVYAIPSVFLFNGGTDRNNVERGKLRQVGRGDKLSLLIPDATEDWLRESYAKWLDTEGVARFGEPLQEEAAWSAEARAAFAEHGEPGAPGGEGGQVETREPEKLDLSTRGQQEQPTGELTDRAAKLMLTVREAFGFLGDPDEQIERRVRDVKGEERLLRILLNNATVRWHREHKDEPCPWEQTDDETTTNDERGETDGGTQAGSNGQDDGEKPAAAKRRTGRRQPAAQASLTDT